LLCGAAAGWPLAARAQQPSKMKRVAVVHSSFKPADLRIGGDPVYTIFFEEMKRLGYVEGVNLVVDRYSAEGRTERWPEIFREVVTARPDVIYVISPMLKLLLSETHTIPIVAWTADPVAAGYISSLARPGGNVTGVSLDAGAGYGAKRLELLAEAVSKLSNVRLLAVDVGSLTPLAKMTIEAAEKLKIPLQIEFLHSPIDEREYRRAFDEMKRDRVDGVIIGSDSEIYSNRLLLGRVVQEYRLPAIGSYSDSVKAGALMSYAFDLKAGARRLAAQVVEILNGGKPAEMPFFQETHFELVINLKAAKALGIDVPDSLLVRADEVIE
jgi:putative ABC transport system substrate-binding protein